MSQQCNISASASCDKTGKVYKIAQNPVCGRQLVASRKIYAGELILDEPTLLSGPGFARGGNRQFALDLERGKHQRNSPSNVPDFTQEDVPVCLVCCANLNSSSCIRCPLCDLILCSEHCKTSVQHSLNECIIFPKIRYTWNQKENRSKKSLYNLVLVIRGLYYKFRDPTKWTQIIKLESKSEALGRVGAFADLSDVFNSLTWEMFSSSSGLAPENKETRNFDYEETMNNLSVVEAAQHCLGVMRINAFSSYSESYSREVLFFIASFMSHCCVINTDRQIGGNGIGDFRMVVRASVDIEQGEAITTTYLSLLYNTNERHQIMITSWLFVCRCKRCQDPTECQAFSNGIICQRKLNTDGNRVCCDNNIECSCLENEKPIIEKINTARPRNFNISKVEYWLDSHDTGALLHVNHSTFAHVKLFLCQFYGRQSGGIEKLTSSQLNRKVIYCLQTISIFEKVCPGLQMIRGVILFELWCGLRKLADLKQLPLSIKSLSATEGVTPLLATTTAYTEVEITEIKKKALEILKYALPNSPEEAMSNCLLYDIEDINKKEI